MDSASLAVGTPVLDDDDDLDFFFFNPDGTVAHDELEDELLEGFLLPAHIPQRVHFLRLSLLTTINIRLSSLPTADRARLRDEVHYILNTLHHFQALPGVGGLHAPTVFGPRAPSIHPGSHYVRLFCQGQALRGHAPTLWAEILLTFQFFDRLKVLSRALVATLDLALESSPYDLECSRSFATLFIPKFTIPHTILERVLSPPNSHILSGVPFGPLTVADHESLALLMPTHITTPLYMPPARPCCRHVSGQRRRLPRHLPASPSIQKPPGFSYFFHSRPALSHRPSTTHFLRVLPDAFGFAEAPAPEAERTPVRHRGELVVCLHPLHFPTFTYACRADTTHYKHIYFTIYTFVYASCSYLPAHVSTSS